MQKLRIIGILALTAVLIGGCLFGQPVKAQEFVGDNDVSASIVPENPGPLQNTTVTLSSLSTDLNLASMQWSVNGKTVLSGTGKKSYSFTTGNIGQTTTINITVDVANIPTITKRIVIQPLETDLLWEAADAYVPPFYKGRALLPSEGLVKVVAIPNIRNNSGTLMKPGDFSYNWTRNYNNDQTASGYGKNYFTFRDSYLNDKENVSVNLTSADSGYRASKSLSITTIAPNVVLYQIDPKLGIRFDRTIRRETYFVVPPEGASLIAEPYFFSPKNALDTDLSYTWNVNEEDIVTPSVKNIFSVRPQQSGVANLKITVESAQKLFQSASRSLSLTLDANE